MTTFKIRDTNTGLFLMKGYRPYWSKRGRVWTNIGALRNSLNHLKPEPNWEIVEFQLQEIRTKPADVEVREMVERKLHEKRK